MFDKNRKIIMKVEGGLGNQLFFYAFDTFLKKRGINAVWDCICYLYVKDHGGFLLHNIIDGMERIEFLFSDIEETRKNDAQLFDLLKGRILRKFVDCIIRKQYSIIKYEERNLEQLINNIYFSEKNIFLEDYWQDAEIVFQVIDEIRDRIIPLDNNCDKAYELEKIRHTNNSCSIHLRRGDYVLPGSNWSGICTEEYYKTAIDYIKNEKNDSTFFVFSDDYEYAVSFFKDCKNTIVIKPSEERQSHIDLLLMSECESHIIANSSFSWWGAVLSQKDGITIMPSQWKNNTKVNRLATDKFVQINNEGLVVHPVY